MTISKQDQAIEIYNKVMATERIRVEKQSKVKERIIELKLKNEAEQTTKNEIDEELAVATLRYGHGELNLSDLQPIEARQSEATNALARTRSMIATLEKELSKFGLDPVKEHPHQAARAAFFRVVFLECREQLISEALPIMRRAYAALTLSTRIEAGWVNFMFQALALPEPTRAELQALAKEIEALLEEER